MTTPALQAAIEQRAKDIGLTVITDAERIKLHEIMVAEQATGALAVAENRLAAAIETFSGGTATPLA